MATLPSSARARAGLGLLLVAVALSSGAIVLLDRAPWHYDPVDNLLSTVALGEALRGEEGASMSWWVRVTWFRPPLPALMSVPATWILGSARHGIQLTEVLLFLCTILLVFHLGEQLSSRSAGLLAALLFAAFPLAQGWGRAGNADPVVWLALLGLFLALLRLDLERPWHALGIGLGFGLALGTRLVALPYLIGPAIWLLAFRLRSRRALLHLGAAIAVAVNVFGWWYAEQIRFVLRNVLMSSDAIHHPGQEELSPLTYLTNGYGWVVGGALVAWLLARRRRWLRADVLWLFALWVGVPLLQFTLLWAIWSRYLVALVPQCALLVGVAVDRLGAAWRPRSRRALWVLTALAGLLPLGLYYTGARGLSSGLMRPDRREHTALGRLLAQVPAGEPVLLVDNSFTAGYALGLHLSHGAPARRLVAPYDLDNPFTMDLDTRVRHVLHALPSCEGPLRHDDCGSRPPMPDWERLRRRFPLTHVATAVDPNRYAFELYRFAAPLTGAELR